MSKIHFPKDFLWGTSTAAHQVEGNNFNSDWWRWEQQDDKRPKSGIACDHYHLFKEDFTLAKQMGQNSHRLSIEWARIEPKPGEFDKKEIGHYRDVLEELKKLDMKAFVTLWHFTLPVWFADLGGFERESNLRYFENYVSFCAKELDGLVDFWVTINEPTTYALKGYLIGVWPPGKKNLFSTLKVYKNLASAHNLAYWAIKRIDSNYQVGAAHQLVSYYSKGGLLNNILTRLNKYFVDDYFYDKTPNTHDFMGLNYYFRNPISFKYFLVKVDAGDYEKILEDKGRRFGWGMNPSGLYSCLVYLEKRFNKPIYILEHGISDPEEDDREEYIAGAVNYIQKAIENGVDVRGYLHWTLMDNFEWNLGYVSKFGLFSVEPGTLKRVPKKSAYYFKNLIGQCRGIIPQT